MNDTGRGYTIVIKTEGHKADQWMTFALWHSIRNFASEAKVIIALPQKSDYLIHWAYTFNIPIKSLSSIAMEDNLIVMPCHCMAVRKFDIDNIGPSLTAKDDQTTFVDYSERCGKFVLNKWINTDVIPFGRDAEKFWGQNMSQNETKVIQYWKMLSAMFRTIS